MNMRIAFLLLVGLLLCGVVAGAQTVGEGACTWAPCEPSIPVVPNAVLTTDPTGNILFSQVLPSGMVVAPQCVTTANASGSPDAIQIPKLPCVPTTTLLVLTTNGANATTTPTIQFPGGQPQVILRWTGASMAVGDIPGAGAKVELTNNGKNWFLMTLISTGGGGGGTGTVTSVGLSEPVEFNVTGSPVTTSGTLAVTKANETANTVWAGPASGGAAPPTFRPLVSSDLPPGTGMGTVTSVGLTEPVEFVVSGSPVVSAGTLSVAKANETANTVWAGPSSGPAAQPTFRPLTTSDLPGGLGTVSSVGLAAPPEFTVSGSPVTTSGVLTLSKATEAANTVWAGPTTGGPAAPTFRTIALQDLPAQTCAVLPAGGCPFDIVMFMPGVPFGCSTVPNPCIVRVAITRNVSCPTAFAGSAGIARESATGTTVVNVNQVTAGTGTLRGTLTWSAAGTVASLASSAGMTLVANDIVEFAFPTTSDATLGDVAITLKCART